MRNQTAINPVRGGVCHVTSIANHFISSSRRENLVVTNLSIQKLVYFAYGWTWAVFDKKLFDDRIEAWPLGPVIPSVYYQLKEFGGTRITKRIKEYDHIEDKFFFWYLSKGTNLYNHIDWVWNKYKTKRAGHLVELTHNPGTPWYETVRQSGYGVEIDDNLIRSHFAELNG